MQTFQTHGSRRRDAERTRGRRPPPVSDRCQSCGDAPWSAISGERKLCFSCRDEARARPMPVDVVCQTTSTGKPVTDG
jgi:hypothetical protein